jgi:hypothetical protein
MFLFLSIGLHPGRTLGDEEAVRHNRHLNSPRIFASIM